MIVDEQAGPQQPGRAQPRRRRQHEPHGTDEMRRHPQQDFALDQRLAHQPEPAVLEIAQAAVDQLGGGRRGAGREVVLLDQQHAKTAAGGVAGDAGAVDAAADDGEIEIRHAPPAGPGRQHARPRDRAQATDDRTRRPMKETLITIAARGPQRPRFAGQVRQVRDEQRRSVGDRDDVARGSAHEPRHRAGGDDGLMLRIGLVVLLDVVEIVEVVHHQAVRLAQRALRGVGKQVEPFEPRAVAEMEARDRIERRAAPVAPAQKYQAAARSSGSRTVSDTARSRHQSGRSSAVSAERSSSLDPARRLARALAAEPGGEVRHRRQRDEGREPRNLARNLLDHLLDQEVAERDAGQPALAVGDRIEHRRRGAIGFEPLALRRPGSARSPPGSRGSARPRRRSAARRPAPDGRTRSSAGPADRCGGAGRSSRGSRAPPHSG